MQLTAHEAPPADSRGATVQRWDGYLNDGKVTKIAPGGNAGTDTGSTRSGAGDAVVGGA